MVAGLMTKAEKVVGGQGSLFSFYSPAPYFILSF